MTDSTGAVKWSADYKPFGEATVDPSSTITNNLRFPGQYFDVETGNNYNYFRDYNPAIGRYVEADPLGINGGDNLMYAYTTDNPISAIDLQGLKPCLCEISEKQGMNAVATAATWAGVPYDWGHNTRAGADCSGTIGGIFKESGLEYVDVSSGGIAGSSYYKETTNCRTGDVVVWPGKHMVIYAPNVGGTDPYGKPADAWGAQGAHVPLPPDYTTRGMIPFGRASISAIDRNKGPHKCYRRLTDCKNLK